MVFEAAQNFVDMIERICPNHTDLIDNQEVKAFKEVDLVFVKAFMLGIFGVSRYIGTKRKLEK